MDVLTTSARIKARCKAQKISVKNLLEQTQINRNFIYDLEKGGQIPSAEKLERIADSPEENFLRGECRGDSLQSGCPAFSIARSW